MKRLFSKLSLLFCLVLVVQIASVHTTAKAADNYSDVKGKYSDYLRYGFDMVRAPIADYSDIKVYPILDLEKLQAKKGSAWYDSKPGSSGFSYKTCVEETKNEVKRSLATELGMAYKSETSGYSSKVSASYSETETKHNFYGEMNASHLLEKYTTAMEYEELRSCLNNDFVTLVNTGNYQKVFEKYGTHLVRQAYVGGRLIVEFETKKECKKSEDELKMMAEQSYNEFSSSSSTTSKNSIEEFESNCTYSISGSGGNLSTLPSKLDDTSSYTGWTGTIASNPAMYQVNDCIPIWDLFDDANVQKNMKIAYYKYFNKYLEETRESIPFVSSLRVTSRGNGDVDKELKTGEIVTKTDASKGYINSDLNKGSGGKYIYLIYEKGVDPSKKIVDIRTNYIGERERPTSNVYVRINKDLNEGAGGAYIYFEYKQENNLILPGYQDLCTRNDAYDLNDNWVPIRSEDGEIVDLNKGAGGAYIYLFGYVDPVIAEIDKQITANDAEIKKLDPSYVPTSIYNEANKPVVISKTTTTTTSTRRGSTAITTTTTRPSGTTTTRPISSSGRR